MTEDQNLNTLIRLKIYMKSKTWYKDEIHSSEYMLDEIWYRRTNKTHIIERVRIIQYNNGIKDLIKVYYAKIKIEESYGDSSIQHIYKIIDEIDYIFNSYNLCIQNYNINTEAYQLVKSIDDLH